MALTKRGDFWFGDSQSDIRAEILRYSQNGYPASKFADARCTRGHSTFGLQLDEDAGVAVRRCGNCGVEHVMADGADYLDEAELEECACPCGNERFEITVGVSLYEDSADVRWLYLGCRCEACGLTAVYGDWKNEFEGFEALLANV